MNVRPASWTSERQMRMEKPRECQDPECPCNGRVQVTPEEGRRLAKIKLRLAQELLARRLEERE